MPNVVFNVWLGRTIILLISRSQLRTTEHESVGQDVQSR